MVSPNADKKCHNTEQENANFSSNTIFTNVAKLRGGGIHRNKMTIKFHMIIIIVYLVLSYSIV